MINKTVAVVNILDIKYEIIVWLILIQLVILF